MLVTIVTSELKQGVRLQVTKKFKTDNEPFTADVPIQLAFTVLE
jgi:hypothetical protein